MLLFYMYALDTPIEELTRVGKATAKQLSKLGISRLIDLIYYWPFRYDDYSQLVAIKELRPSQIVTVSGKIILIENRRAHHRRMTITEALLEDATGSIKIIWFNQPFLIKNLRPGDRLFISGKVELDRLGLQFVSPSYEKITGQDNINTAKIVPVYPATERLTQKQLRFLINLALKSVNLINDWLPEHIIAKYRYLPLVEAIKQIHFPDNFAILAKARARLKFDELFLIQLQSQLNKKYLAKTKAPQIEFKQPAIKKFVSQLPFVLTADQKKAVWQIFQDIDQKQPMNRLLEGDVGSGKTLVALLAMLNTALNGYQAVLMVPTEILAQQHYQSFCRYLQELPITISLLSRSNRQSNASEAKLSAKEISDSICLGNCQIIIGTHALISEKINFANLGLVVVDEQHRFGVAQRKKIKEKNLTKLSPHFLSMTATPIPRSLALILYGDLELSIIKQMPQGRKKIITKLVAEKNRHQAYQFIREQINQGRQVFVVCPLIDPSDKLGVKSVKEEYDKLDQQVFPDLQIAFLHGKLKTAEKDKVMADFKSGLSKILVSTSVVEVGIDIPNATIMMIEGADRFGLAQLHQFRGRVGRGEYQSYCFLFTDNYSPKTRERLSALVKSADGFALAEYDLQFRGPGEVYGTQQSGMPNLQLASLTDLDLIRVTKQEAEDFFNNYKLGDFPELALKLDKARFNSHLE